MNDAVLKIGAEIHEALAKLNQLASAYSSFTANISNQVAQAGKAVSGQEKFWDSLFLKIAGGTTVGQVLANSIMGAMGLINDAIQGAIGYIIELGKRGSDVENTTIAFRGLTAGLGADGLGKVLPEARAKTAGLISDFDLMRAANRAMIFGIDLSKNSFGTLGEAAIKLGRAMGLSATKSLDDLVLAIGRVSPRILDNLGIIVKVTEANKEWIKQHGGTVASMSGAERVLAFQNLAMKKIEETLKNLGPLQLTVADLWTIMTVKMVNWQDRVATAINRSEVLHTLLTEVGRALDGAFEPNHAKMVDIIVSGVETLVIWLVKAAQYVVDFGSAARREYSQVAALGATLTVGIMQLVEGFLQAHSAFSGLATSMNPFSKATKEADDKVKTLLKTVTQMRAKNEEHALSAMQAAKGQDTFSIAADKTSRFLGQLAIGLEFAKGRKIEYKVQTQLNTVAENDDTDATDKGAKAKVKLAEKLELLNSKLKEVEPTEANLILITREFGASIKDLTDQADISKVKIPQAVAAWEERIKNAKLDEVIRKNGDAMRDANVKMFDAMINETGTKVKEQGKTFDQLKETFAKAAEEMTLIDLRESDKQQAQMDIKLREEIRKLGTIPAVYHKSYSEAMTFVKMQYQVKDNDRTIAMAKEIKDLGIIPKEYNAKYAAAVQSIRDKYGEMGEADNARRAKEIASLGPIPSEYEKVYTAANAALISVHRKATEELAREEKIRFENAKRTWSVDFKAVIDLIPTIIQNSLTGGGGWGGAGKAVVSKIGETFGGRAVTGAMNGLFNKFSTQISNTLGMTMTSTLGAAIPGIGAAIGALAGPLLDKIVGFFKGKPEHEKIMEDVGKRFGTKISEGLAKQIQKDAKDLFGRSHYAAEIFNLDKIINEAGGLNSKNYDMFTAKLREVFVLLQTGKMSADQARETLGKNFGAFAEHLKKSGDLASKGFLELIALNARFGLESKEVMAFVSERATTAASGLDALLVPIKTAYGTLGKELEDAKKKVEELEAAGKKGSAEHTTAVATLNAVLTKQKDGTAAVGEEIDRVGRLTLATFNAQIAAGVSYVTAISNVGPALDSIIALQKSLGIENENAAVKELIRFRELTNQNKDLVLAVAGLNQTMVAMQNIGALNADTLADLEAQGLSMYTKLTAAGFTEQQALMQMKGWLESVIKSHKDLGIPIDENTQKLINQAREQGILKAEGMSTNDILMSGIGALIEAVGGKLPEAFRKWRDEAKSSTSEVRKGIGKTGDEFDTVSDKLDDSVDAFKSWSDKAVASIDKVRDGVDGVSVGDSPGGIKEWVPMLQRARAGFAAFGYDAAGSVHRLRNEVDALGLDSDMSLTARNQATSSPSSLAGVTANADQEIHIHVHGMDGRELGRYVERAGQDNLNERRWKIPSDVVLEIGQRTY